MDGVISRMMSHNSETDIWLRIGDCTCSILRFALEYIVCDDMLLLTFGAREDEISILVSFLPSLQKMVGRRVFFRFWTHKVFIKRPEKVHLGFNSKFWFYSVFTSHISVEG